MESQVFLLGHWKNYDELESSLSIEELVATIAAINDRDNEERKFFAALNGVDLEGEAQASDITSLKGFVAQEEGFGVGMGLGHIMEGV